MAPVWINLPGLAPNFYQESYLRNIIAPVGMLLQRDNATKCATHTDGARVCVLMDISQPPVHHVWIGMPRQPSSVRQEINYETLPAFCTKCNTQGHNIGTCKLLVKESGKKKELGLVWKPQKIKETEKVVVLGGNRPSVSGEPVGDDLIVKENNLEAKKSGMNKEVAVMESEKTEPYGGEEGLIRSEEGLSKDLLESMEKNEKKSNEMRCAELIIEEATLEVNTNIVGTIGGDSGKSGGAGLLNGEKECEPISINGSLDGVILEKLDDNVEELANEKSWVEESRKSTQTCDEDFRVCFGFRGSRCVTAF
jgi:hypothetical protein